VQRSDWRKQISVHHNSRDRFRIWRREGWEGGAGFWKIVQTTQVKIHQFFSVGYSIISISMPEWGVINCRVEKVQNGFVDLVRKNLDLRRSSHYFFIFVFISFFRFRPSREDTRRTIVLAGARTLARSNNHASACFGSSSYGTISLPIHFSSQIFFLVLYPNWKDISVVFSNNFFQIWFGPRNYLIWKYFDFFHTKNSKKIFFHNL